MKLKIFPFGEFYFVKMNSDQEEKDNSNNLAIILWPVWVPAVIGVVYLIYLSS